jgi:dipeptidyl aminopeptidase/acylaminoacyl peptidase
VSANWVSRNTIEIGLREGTLHTYRRAADSWEEVSVGRRMQFATSISTESRMRVEVRQNMNDPPVLYAVDRRTGTGREIFDPNPSLRKRFALGHVEMIEWKNIDGREWTGRLYYPANFDPHRRYPLVIQTHGFAGKDEYSLSGQGGQDGAPLGPTWSAFLAQPLATRDIAVLQLGGPNAGPRPYGQATDVERIGELVTAIQAAAERLVGMGVVDRLRVGLMGWSATGPIIEQAITDSEFPYAAAIAADYADHNYVQAAVSNWDRTYGGAAPFGRGLEAWLNNSPAFNVERVRTPVQLVLTSSSEGNSSFLWQWEMFSRLKYLNKPVELYVLPDIGHGSHLTQNPRQLLALQTRAMDWWLFWLRDEEDPNPGKAAQYVQWRSLLEMHKDDTKRPKPQRLQWSAS